MKFTTNITKSILHELVDYDPVRDVFIWKERKEDGRIMPPGVARAFNATGTPGKEVGGIRARSKNRPVNFLGNQMTIGEMKEMYGAVRKLGPAETMIERQDNGKYAAMISKDGDWSLIGEFIEKWHAEAVCKEAVRRSRY